MTWRKYIKLLNEREGSKFKRVKNFEKEIYKRKGECKEWLR